MKRRTSARQPSTSVPSRRRAQPAATFGGHGDLRTILAGEAIVFAAVSAVDLAVTPEAGAVELKPVRIGYFRPEAGEVFVAGTFNDWDPRATPLKRDELGDWSVTLQLPPGEYRYRLVVDGEWRDDPCAQQTARNSFGGFDAVVAV